MCGVKELVKKRESEFTERATLLDQCTVHTRFYAAVPECIQTKKKAMQMKIKLKTIEGCAAAVIGHLQVTNDAMGQQVD